MYWPTLQTAPSFIPTHSNSITAFTGEDGLILCPYTFSICLLHYQSDFSLSHIQLSAASLLRAGDVEKNVGSEVRQAGPVFTFQRCPPLLATEGWLSYLDSGPAASFVMQPLSYASWVWKGPVDTAYSRKKAFSSEHMENPEHQTQPWHCWCFNKIILCCAGLGCAL